MGKTNHDLFSLSDRVFDSENVIVLTITASEDKVLYCVMNQWQSLNYKSLFILIQKDSGHRHLLMLL